jgi:acyl-CoA thioesterase II
MPRSAGRPVLTEPATDAQRQALALLVDGALTLVERGPDEFVGGEPPRAFDRLYGGQVAAQALRAAGATVPAGQRAHSLHVSFLRLGDPAVELVLTVERVRDTRRAATRLVRATQAGVLLALATASFQEPRPGVEHGARPVSLPAPDELPTRAESLRARYGDAVPANARASWAIDIRHVDRAPWESGVSPQPRNRLWVRTPAPLPDDPLLHACVLAYASDLTMFEPITYPHESASDPLSWEMLTRGETRGGSLDHTVWFHRPFRVDEWLLHEHGSPVAADSRGLSTGDYRAADGAVVATVAQEVALLHTPNHTKEL